MSLCTFAILPAIDFVCTLITMFTAMVNGIGLATALVNMLVVRAFDGFALAILAGLIIVAWGIAGYDF